MLREFKTKEIERWNNLLTSYAEDVLNLQKQIDEVEEKYRKLAEEETKNLTEAVDYYKSMEEDCKSKLAALGGETPVTVAPKPKTRRSKVESKPAPQPEPETIIDTLFPENNETEQESDTTEDPGPEFDGAGFTNADNYVDDLPLSDEEKSATVEEISEDIVWNVPEKPEDTPEAAANELNMDDGFPEFPEEWN